MGPDDGGKPKPDKRRERLVASLRENLKRRKTQQRSRAVEKPPTKQGSGQCPPPELKE